MGQFTLTEEDLKQITELGITSELIFRYIEFFKKGNRYVHLNRPCKLGDGIEVIPENLQEQYISIYEKELRKGRMSKFVPASGAATRMFQCLWKILEIRKPITLEDLKLREENNSLKDTIVFFENIQDFAFFDLINEYCKKSGVNIEEYLSKGPLQKLAQIILHDLNFGTLPKALIPFHKYENEIRTAFEEHIVEAIEYLRDEQDVCRLHFTVGEEFLSLFSEELKRLKQKYDHLTLDITFSVQSSSTHTIAVDMNNVPFRDEKGRLLFRPGGHGSLLKNLNEFAGDIVFIKNIDNVVSDRLKPLVVRWKKILGGLLITVEQNVHRLVRQFHNGDKNFLMEAEKFCIEWNIPLSETYSYLMEDEKKKYLYSTLNRPIRVCGMVPNAGEPGGGPFWIIDKKAESKQIVEKAQVNLLDKTQRLIWETSTHFNPVDIVCSLRDANGQPFDLEKFKDPNSVIITEKHYKGKPIKVLEHPGLWNGSMAHWITIFIEVPSETFQPVKKVTDLLKSSHS